MQIKLPEGLCIRRLFAGKNRIRGLTYRWGCSSYTTPTNNIEVRWRRYRGTQGPLLYFRSDDRIGIHKFINLLPYSMNGA